MHVQNEQLSLAQKQAHGSLFKMAYRRRKRSSTAYKARRKRYRYDRRRRGRMVAKRTSRGTLVYRKLNIGSFPRTKVVYLRYVENFTLNAGSAPSSVAYVFRSNGLYDPNYTGTGHQPMYFDNYSAIYSTWQVMKSTIRFVLCDNHITNTTIGNDIGGTTTTASQYFAASERSARMFLINDMSPTDYPSDINTLIEEGSKNIKWKYAPQNTSQYVQSLTTSVWPHKLANVSYKEANLKGAGSDPTLQTYFICGIDSFPGSNADVMNCQAIITYKVQFSDLKVNLTQN